MTRNVHASLGLAILAVLGLVLWAAFAGKSEGVNDAADRLPVSQDVEREPASSLDAPPKLASAALDAPPRAEAAATAANVDVASPPATVALHGIILLDDPAHRVRSGAKGMLDVQLGDGGGNGAPPALEPAFQSLTVVDGAWQLDVEPARLAEKILFTRLRYDDVQAVISTPRGFVPVPAERVFEIQARVPLLTSLRVVAAESGVDLTGVALISPRGFPADRLSHPGSRADAQVTARDLVSPIDIDAALGDETRGRSGRYLVGAPERAWTPVELDRTTGGERIIALERGGALAIDVAGAELAPRARLRLRPATGETPIVDETLRKASKVEIAALRPGKLILSAEIGDWWKNPVVLGTANVEIVAGTTATATLAVKRAAEPEYGDARGVVLVPKAWHAASLSGGLSFVGPALDGSGGRHNLSLERTTTERDGFDAFSWSATKLHSGRHELRVSEPTCVAVIEVFAGTRTDHVLEIPPPCELSVRIVRAGTQDDVEVSMLMWHIERPAGSRGGTVETAERDPATKRYVLRAPCAVVELQVSDDRFQPCRAKVDLARGERETTLEVQQGCGIVIELRDGETPVPFPSGWDETPEPAAGTLGSVSGITTTGTIYRYLVSGPGTYTLKLPKLPGYREMPDLSFVVVANQFLEQTVQLEREHQ